jgi:hypothetical protein
MAGTIDDRLPTAFDAALRVAEAEAAKAEEHKRAAAAAEAEKKALIESFQKVPSLSLEEKIDRAASIIQRAVNNGRFPHELCTDGGRAINQGEPGWENTLTGRPKDMYQFWHEHLRPRGYKVHAQIVDFPGGMPGEIAFFLKWR